MPQAAARIQQAALDTQSLSSINVLYQTWRGNARGEQKKLLELHKCSASKSEKHVQLGLEKADGGGIEASVFIDMREFPRVGGP